MYNPQFFELLPVDCVLQAEGPRVGRMRGGSRGFSLGFSLGFVGEKVRGGRRKCPTTGRGEQHAQIKTLEQARERSAVGEVTGSQVLQ